MLPNPSQTPESFEQRLNAHPELRAKVEVLLSVVENNATEIRRAKTLQGLI